MCVKGFSRGRGGKVENRCNNYHYYFAESVVRQSEGLIF